MSQKAHAGWTTSRPNNSSQPFSLGQRLWNLAAFQAGWFACAGGAARGWDWLGPLAVALLALIHLKWMPNPRGEAGLMLAAGLAGMVLDGSLAAGALLSFPPHDFWPVPLWIVALWVNFSMALNVSLRWLQSRLWLALLLGSLAGPAAYLAGARLGAVSFPRGPLPALAALALVWGLALPLFLSLARRRFP